MITRTEAIPRLARASAPPTLADGPGRRVSSIQRADGKS